MFSRNLFLCAALAALPVLPTTAAEVYVPIASPEGAPVAYRTEVAVTNPGEEARTFFPELKTGPQALGRLSLARTVEAGRIEILRQLTTPGRPGLLTLSALDELVITAQLETLSREGRVLSSVPAPVVTEDNLLPAGAVAHLQELRQAEGGALTLGLVNLSAERSQCRATAFQADGAVAGEAELTAEPRSALLWSKPLEALALGSFVNARAEVTCDGPFYAYALATGADGKASFQLPEVPETAEGDLDSAFEEAAAAATCSAGDAELLPLEDGAIGFRIDGDFLRVGQGDPCRAFELPLENNIAYRNVRVEFDFHLQRWTTPLFHNLAAVRRSGRTRNERVLYAGVTIRGDNKKTTLDLGREQFVKAVGPWKTGTTYHVVMETDVPSRRVTLSVFEREELVQQMGGRMTVREIKSLAGKRVKVDFSSPKVGDGAYFPPTGWTYSNLVVKATR